MYDFVVETSYISRFHPRMAGTTYVSLLWTFLPFTQEFTYTFFPLTFRTRRFPEKIIGILSPVVRVYVEFVTTGYAPCAQPAKLLV